MENLNILKNKINSLNEKLSLSNDLKEICFIAHELIILAEDLRQIAGKTTKKKKCLIKN